MPKSTIITGLTYRLKLLVDTESKVYEKRPRVLKTYPGRQAWLRTWALQ